MIIFYDVTFKDLLISVKEEYYFHLLINNSRICLENHLNFIQIRLITFLLNEFKMNKNIYRFEKR